MVGIHVNLTRPTSQSNFPPSLVLNLTLHDHSDYSFALNENILDIIAESLNGDILQKSMKDFYTKPKLELHSER